MLTIADKINILPSGKIGIGTVPNATLDLTNKTDGIVFPTGTNAQRPSVGYNGMMRYNTDISSVEMYINNEWKTCSLYRPVISSVSQTSFLNYPTITVTGSFFEPDQKWSLIGQDGTIIYPTIQFISQSSVSFVPPSPDVSSNNVPYMIKVHSKRSGLDFISPTIKFTF